LRTFAKEIATAPWLPITDHRLSPNFVPHEVGADLALAVAEGVFDDRLLPVELQKFQGQISKRDDI
jgi:ABC-type nitrate/sulfonate/bicarbonate transport system substrate-binding protein